MGIRDYSCFLCSCEGEQCLTNWRDYRAEDGDDEDVNYNDRLCSYPTEEGESGSFGKGQCYLFHFKQNPLNIVNKYYKCENVKYSWDDWCFNGYDKYREILSSDNKTELYSIWKNNDDWIINICPDCYNYFISDKWNDPPSKLLTNILEKFSLFPFNEFSINCVKNIQNMQNMQDMPNDDKHYKLKQLFPIKCAKLRDYIRSFCNYLKLRDDDFKFEFGIDNNPLIKILEDGLDDDVNYDPNLPGLFDNNIMIKPIELAYKNMNKQQMESLIKRGAKLSLELIKTMITNSDLRYIIWNNFNKCKHEDIADIIFNKSDDLWITAPDMFFQHNDFEYAIQLLVYDIENDKLLLHLINIFHDSYKFTDYKHYVYTANLKIVTKLLELGFSPQTHFSDVIDYGWVEGAKLCLKYGAKLDYYSKSILERINKPAMIALFK
jgi:hypothetical protein